MKRIKVKNFKCWEEIELETKPLTILVGPNGSGKSSILQALILLKRFVTTPSTLSPETLGDFSYADYLNLGRFEEIVHKHEKDNRNIEIAIEVIDDEHSTSYSVIFGNGPCRARLASKDVKIDLVVEFSLPYSLNVTSSEKIETTEGHTYSIIWNGVSASVQHTAPQPPPSEKLTSMLNAHLNLLKGIYFVHPRHFFKTWSYPYAPSIDYSKLFMTDQELTNVMAMNSDIEEKVARWCEKISGVEILSKAVPPYPTLRIEARWERFRVPLALEGAGLNRLVYILTSLAIPETKLLLVEEPETHLHPKLLFDLGRLLPMILKEEGKQMITTVHSEHLLLALITGVAEGTIKRDDFAIYYLEREGLAAKAQKLAVSDKGQVEGGLPGFFETDWEATERYLRALAKGVRSNGASG
ncbi:MAG: AAA family ATPase [Candidatus Micrarchaeia archaeon]